MNNCWEKVKQLDGESEKMAQEPTKRVGYQFRLVNIECLPNSANYNVIMDLEESIEELLPYLAACLPGCTYTHGTGVINVMQAGHIIAIYPGHVTVTDLRTHDEAEEYCRECFQRIQEVKANATKIQPVFDKRPSLSVLDIVRVLPKTNCGECGMASCTAFAAGVFRRESTITDCAPLMRKRDDYQDLFRELQLNGYQI